MESSSISNSFYLYVGATIAAMMGGAYLVYTNLTEKHQEEVKNIVKEESIEVEKNKEKIPTSINNEHCNTLTKEKAIKIYAEITKSFEEYAELLETESARLERKKAAQIGEDAWISVCSKFLQTKHFYFENNKRSILQKYKVSQSEFDKLVQSTISFFEIEQELFKIYVPKFKDSVLPDKEYIKEAYIYHCQKMYDSLVKSEKVNSQYVHPEEKTFFMLLERVSIDDEMYYKYKLSFNQVKYLINYYDLYSEPEVMNWYKIIPS